ncbi:hypothetical protein [Pandoraea norimbergensis]|uniref:Uncharacterized protein n=1 Tax=Pandoraea norimbergensis TaxID=93219 RepID=A0ABM5WNC4_9BURK|nr:hypothetical protein [Pandoraea norimbergensis]ALS62137.1 hypothetical protein AT302_22460 [Pandoraea norimbergensis]
MSTSINATALPLQGYPGLQLSDNRAQLIANCVATLDDDLPWAMSDAAIDASCERFIDDVTRMGVWDRLMDMFQSGSQKREILKAAARCHVASYAHGRRYLFAKGHYPLKTGDQSLYLLQRLLPEARTALLTSHAARLPAVSALSIIVVTIPGTPLRLPLLPACFSHADGALSEHEAGLLMDLRTEEWMTVSDTIASRDDALSEPDCALAARQEELLANAFSLGGCQDDAATEFFKAMQHFARGRQYDDALRCLARGRVCYSANEVSERVTNAIVSAAHLCSLNAQYAMSGVFYAAAADIHEEADGAAMAARFRERADECFRWADLLEADVRNEDAIAVAIDKAIRRHRDALSSSGFASGSTTVFMDDMCDPISAMAFDAGEGERWCLLLRGEHQGKRTYDLITVESAQQLEAIGTHPLTREALLRSDILRGVEALDLLVATEPRPSS